MTNEIEESVTRIEQQRSEGDCCAAELVLDDRLFRERGGGTYSMPSSTDCWTIKVEKRKVFRTVHTFSESSRESGSEAKDLSELVFYH